MDNVMTKGFCELSTEDLSSVYGGVNWWTVAGGVLCCAGSAVWFAGGPGKVAAGLCFAGGVTTIISAF